LELTGKSMAIAGQCNRTWRAIVRKHSPKPNKLFVSSVVQSIPLLQWAKDNGCPWNTNTSALIAREGQLSVLQWARENGCSWNAKTSAYAARGGHLGVLQWLHKDGCPWDKWTCIYAAEGGLVREFEHQIGTNTPWNFAHFSHTDIRGPNMDILEWAYHNGCPL